MKNADLLRERLTLPEGGLIVKEVFNDDFTIGVFFIERSYSEYDEDAEIPPDQREGYDVVEVFLTAVIDNDKGKEVRTFHTDVFRQSLGCPRKVKKEGLPFGYVYDQPDYVYDHKRPIVKTKIGDQIIDNGVMVHFGNDSGPTLFYDLLAGKFYSSPGSGRVVITAPEPGQLESTINEDRRFALLKWEELLGSLPNCELKKGLGGIYDEEDSYIRDNDNIFGGAIFIVFISADLDYHEEAFAMLYFCFYPDGTVQVDHCDNLSDYKELRDPSASALAEFEGYFYDTWTEGYNGIVTVSKQAFENASVPIPEVAPEMFPNIQSEQERSERLAAWQALLDKLPHCDKEYDHDLSFLEQILRDGEIKPKLLLTAKLFECEDEEDSGYKFITVYFCFFEDNTFRIITDSGGASPSGPVWDKMYYYLTHNNNSNPFTLDSWSEGYKKVVEIIEDVYGNSVPEIPE